MQAAGYPFTLARRGGDQGMETPPVDRVVVSERARQLSAGAAGENGSGLKLDFKKLRELAFPAPSAKAVLADVGE